MKTKVKKRDELAQALAGSAVSGSQTWEELLAEVRRLVELYNKDFDTNSGAWKPGVKLLREKLRIGDESVSWFTCLDQVRDEHDALASICVCAKDALRRR